jgi:GrpB-like predicted nucleotidyltransferase (UPF0157 family)
MPLTGLADERVSGRLLLVPFPDEKFAENVEVVPYQSKWADEGAVLAARLARMLPEARATDHIGSTSVPGLPAKNCLDLMVRVESLSDVDLSPLTQAGYRERPEEWNRTEALGTATHPKRVFAPHRSAAGPSTFTSVRHAARRPGTPCSSATSSEPTTTTATPGVA